MEVYIISLFYFIFLYDITSTVIVSLFCNVQVILI